MNAKRLLPLLLVLACLVVYWWLFLDVRMPSVEDAQARSGQREPGEEEIVFRRGALFGFLGMPERLWQLWAGKPPQFSLSDRLPLVAVAGGILAWAAALGWLLLVFLRADRGLTRLETLVFSTAVGLSAVSTFVLVVGLCGWLRFRLVFLLPAAITVAAAAALGWRRWRPAERRAGASPGVGTAVARGVGAAVAVPSRARQRRGRGSKTTAAPTSTTAAPARDKENAAIETRWLSPHWLWLAAPFVAIILLGAVLPPADFDVREYHLEAPKEFYQQGRITFLAHNVYANMPLGAEMFCLVGMAITGDWWLGALAGKTVIALMAPLTALGLWAAGRRFLSPAAGVVAALVYISIPLVIRVSTAGLVDAAMGCYLLLAVYATLLATQRWGSSCTAGPLPMVLLAGYLAGGAVSCKYPALAFVVLPLLFWIAVATLLESGSSRAARGPMASIGATCSRVAGFALAVAAGCGLWFAKNWALTGNPTYPLLYSTFGAQTWDSWKDQRWSAVHGPGLYSWADLESDLARVAMTSEWLSPLVMPLAALALVRRRVRSVWALGAYFAVVIAAWWLFTHRIDRFWLPALPLAALLAGAGACWSADRVWRWGFAAFLAVGLVYSFLAASALPVDANYNRYFISLDRARTDPFRVGPCHPYLNRTVRKGNVLLVGDAQPFDLQIPVLYNTCFDDSIFEQLVKDRSPEEIRAAFAQRRITYVFVDWAEVRRYRSTYGFTPFIRSNIFFRLMDEGILELDRGAPFPVYRAELYRVARPGAVTASKDE